MRRITLVVCLFAVALAVPTAGAAPFFRGRVYGRPVYRPVVPYANRMPGWDWWRIYPYSPYNYGRNPYNPIVVPYVQPVPYPAPYPAPYVSSYPVPSPTLSTTNMTIQGSVQPLTGWIPPPAGQSVLDVQVPMTGSSVTIDGVPYRGFGLERDYLTPTLSGNQPYTVQVTWTDYNGVVHTAQHQVIAQPGGTAYVTFPSPR
jgi:hypothetical protein